MGDVGSTVHVWRIAHDDAAPTEPTLLDSAERDRAGRFLRPGERNRFVTFHTALRQVLGACLDQAPEMLRFRCGPFGKPSLDGSAAASGLRFSLTHDADRGLLAVVCGAEIGVDLEARRPIRGVERLVTRYFAETERQIIDALPTTARTEAALRGWTRKEAYLKATGEGLSVDPHRVVVTVAPGDPPRVLAVEGRPDAARRCRLYDLEAWPDTMATLAVIGAAPAVAWHDWPADMQDATPCPS